MANNEARPDRARSFNIEAVLFLAITINRPTCVAGSGALLVLSLNLSLSISMINPDSIVSVLPAQSMRVAGIGSFE